MAVSDIKIYLLALEPWNSMASAHRRSSTFNLGTALQGGGEFRGARGQNVNVIRCRCLMVELRNFGAGFRGVALWRVP